MTLDHLTRTRRNTLAITLLVTLLALLATGIAVPARAAVAIAVTAANGSVGVPQSLSATVTSSELGSPTGTVSFTVNGQAVGSQGVGGSLGSTATVSWTPTSTGAVTIQARFAGADGSEASDSRTVQVARVDTTAAIAAPSSSPASGAVTLTATVTARQGTYQPTGSVTFLRDAGTVIGTGRLDVTGTARLAYTVPATTGIVRVYASYGGDAGANASTSSTRSISVTSKSTTVGLTVPQPVYVAAQVPLTAKVTPASATGKVDFSVDGRLVGTGTLANGTTTVTWVPSTATTVTVTARYLGGGGLTASSDSSRVTVQQQLKADQITVDPTGSAGPWPAGGTVTLANGQAVAIDVRSASGLNVKLAIAGPCALEGNTVKVRGVGGVCTLTASTNGGNGFAAVTQKYYVQTVAGTQTAKVVAPASGSHPRGSRLNLSRRSTVTNVNQTVRWTVTKGKARCKVVASGKYYRLRLVRTGTCKVRATAPGIADQWRPFVTTRTYTIR